MVFDLPGLDAMPDVLTPHLTLIPIQMLAYHIAVIRDPNPDTFRRDDPRHKDAFGKVPP